MSRRSQSQQKVSKPTETSKKEHTFYNTLLLKKLHSFYEPQLTWQWKRYAPVTKPKTFLTLQIFSKHVFVWYQKKLFVLHLHSRSTLKTNFCIFLYIFLRKIWFQRRSKFLSVMGWFGGGRLNNFLKADCCLGLAKCFTIFHFNWYFWNSSIF